MSEWLEYQKLAAAIYRELEPEAVVTHDDKILGQNSGIPRQIDTSIRYRLAGHELLVIVQAKHLERRANVTQVDELKSVVEDVRANKGVLICSGGFSKSALIYARKVGIDLRSAHDAASEKWPLDIKIPLLWVEEKSSIELGLQIRSSQAGIVRLDKDPRKWVFSSHDGVTTTTMLDLLVREWSTGRASRLRRLDHEHVVATLGMSLRAGDWWVDVESLRLRYRVLHHGWIGDVALSQFKGLVDAHTGELAGQGTLTDKDIPLKRNDSWQYIGDADDYRESIKDYAILTVEKTGVSEESFEYLPESLSVRKLET